MLDERDVIAEYVENERCFPDDIDEKWVSQHCRISQYILQVLINYLKIRRQGQQLKNVRKCLYIISNDFVLKRVCFSTRATAEKC